MRWNRLQDRRLQAPRYTRDSFAHRCDKGCLKTHDNNSDQIRPSPATNKHLTERYFLKSEDDGGRLPALILTSAEQPRSNSTPWHKRISISGGRILIQNDWCGVRHIHRFSTHSCLNLRSCESSGKRKKSAHSDRWEEWHRLQSENRAGGGSYCCRPALSDQVIPAPAA